MKRNIILVILALIMSGCTIEYNLEISETMFTENIEIIETNSNNFNKMCEVNGVTSYKDRINWLYRQNIYTYIDAPINPYTDDKVENVIYYEKEMINTGDTYGLQMDTKGNMTDINDLRSLNFCYDIVQVLNNRDEYIISTSFKNHCFDDYVLLDEVNINITTDMKVTSNNADSVSGNTYTWKITRSNYDNKSISLAMQSIQDYEQDKYEEEQEEKRQEQQRKIKKQKDTTLKVLGGVGIIFLVIVCALGIAIVIKNRRENKL